MFRVTNNTENINSGNGAAKLKAVLSSKGFKVSLSLVIVVAGYFVWTHGRLLPGQFKKDVLTAQASSPLPPEWLERYFGKDYCLRLQYCGPDADPDRDGMTNYEEFLYYTNPSNPDTDGDNFVDGEEIKNLTNPLGVGEIDNARDVNNITQYNPFADQLAAEGLEAIKTGDVTTIDQIQAAAAKLTAMPEFNEIPFKITDKNNQTAVQNYMASLTNASDTYRNTEVIAKIGANILDTTNVDDLNKYIDATDIYATTLVYIETPSDLFEFHKSLYGSLIMQSVIADAQRQLLTGEITEADARQKTHIYTVYYTRFLQDMQKASDTIKTQYDFVFTFSDEQ